MAPKIVDKESRKNELAAVALELFIAQGFEATSISQIAKAAGIGKGTIYEYFDSKEALILHALQMWAENLEHSGELQVDESANPSDKLRTFCVVVMEGFLADQQVMKSFIGMLQLFFTNERFAKLNVVDAISKRFRRVVVDILLDGVSQGVFKKEIAKDADKIAINLFSYLDGIGLDYMAAAIGGNAFFNVREQVDLYLDQLLTCLETERS